MLNPEIAYLLGMIAGKGEIIRGENHTKILIIIPHKNLKIEGENTQLSIRASFLDITNRLQPLIGTDLKADISNTREAIIYFSKDNEDFLIRTINGLFNNENSWRRFRIPDEIFQSSTSIKKEFLRGMSDVTGHIRQSNYRFSRLFENRVYIEIMENWMLTIDLANLLKSLSIPIQTIRFAHPNLVDPNAIDYKKGAKTYKEHQIKIWAEEFEKIGFNIDHKNNLLKLYTSKNRNNWPRQTSIEKSHHAFYWETEDRSKIKPAHPDESNLSIYHIIRGKHFNSWREIAKELGYRI